MHKRPFEMTSAEWYRAYSATSSGGVQERITRSAPSQMVAEFRSRDALRFDARKSVSRRLEAATRGEVRMSSHRDVVVTALKQGLPVPPEVLAEYPGLELRYYRAAQASGM